MGKLYVGVNNIARSANKIYVGVNGIARRVNKIYVGDANGIARLAFNAYTPKSYNFTVWNGAQSASYISLSANEERSYTVPVADVNEAIANGYTKIRVTSVFNSNAYSTGYGCQGNTNGDIEGFSASKADYHAPDSGYGSHWYSNYSTISEGTVLWNKDITFNLVANNPVKFGCYARDTGFSIFMSRGEAYPSLSFHAEFVK